MTEPKIIKDLPGRAVEAFRNSHGGALPSELQPCAHCGFDESSYSKERHLHIVVCLHCGSRSPATATQGGAMTVWNARAPRPEEKALCPHGYFYRTCGLCNTEPSPEPGPSTEIAPPPGHECSAAETIQYAITLLEVSGGNPKVIEYLRAGLDQHEARSSPQNALMPEVLCSTHGRQPSPHGKCPKC